MPYPYEPTERELRTMPMPHLRDYFVNVYRHAWGSSSGLSDREIMRKSRRELIVSIQSLKHFIEANDKRREELLRGR